MKKFIAIMLAFMLAMVVVGCTPSTTDPVLPTSVTVSSAQGNSLGVGDTLTLTATVSPADAENKSVTWSSSNTSIATVANGVVTGVSAGTVTITATSVAAPSVKNSYNLTVLPSSATDVNPTAIAFANNSESLVIGDTLTLSLTYTPTNTTVKGVAWSSSNEAIATVSNGVVTALTAGTTIITATSTANSSVKANVTVTVTEAAEVIEVTMIEIAGDQEMVLGNVFKLTATFTPEDATDKTLTWSSSNEELATVDENGNVSAIADGNVTIKAASANGVEATFDVTIVTPPALESFVITNARDIQVEEFCNLGISETPKYAVYNITYSSSDESIATVDETGKVTALKAGTVIITATDATTGKTDQKTIMVQEKFDPNASPEQIIINGPANVFVGYTYVYTADVLPAGVNQKVVWTSSNTNVATIDATGKITVVGEGQTRIRAVSDVDPTVQSEFLRITAKVEVVEPIPNLNGYEIIIMNAASALREVDPFLEDYNAADKSHKQLAWREIEETYNCKISVVKYPDEAPWGPTRVAWVKTNATNGTSQCDFGVLSAAWLNEFIQSKALVDCTEYFDKYSNNQIEAAVRETATFSGKIYSITTGLSPVKTYPIHGLFYNYGMIQKYGLESPAKLFNNGEWTYDKFVEYCRTAQAILGENEFVIAGGPSLIWAGMVNAAGVKLADKLTMTLNIKHRYSLEAIAALTDIVNAGAWDIDNIAYDAEVTAFREARAIFQPGEYWFVDNANRFPEDLWGKDQTFYGYVPFPYPASISKAQTKVNYMGESILMMLAGRSYPVGIEAGNIFRALQSVYLLTVDKQKSDPLFDADLIKQNTLAIKLDDVESISAMMFFTGEKTLFDPLFDDSFQYSYSGETTTAVINSVRGADPAQEFEAIYSVVETKFRDALGAS